LAGRAAFEICCLCWWEDDGQDDEDTEVVRGGPNQHYSLADARLNFDNYLVKYPPESDSRIGGPDSERIKLIKINIVSAFDGMMTSPQPDELDRLWAIVQAGEEALDEEVRRRAGERTAPPQDWA